jgi:hypothetical protein
MKEYLNSKEVPADLRTRVAAFVDAVELDNWKFASAEIVQETAENLIALLETEDLDPAMQQDFRRTINSAARLHMINNIRPQFLLES